MRRLTLAALVLVGCTGDAGTTPRPPPPDSIAASATPGVAASTSPPTAPPSASPVASLVFTAKDEEIAELIEIGVNQAVPQLKGLNDMDPGKLEAAFLPLGTWITNQKQAVQALTPSSCTAPAVALFVEGMGAYEAMRKKFLAWRDWGAHGHAFHPEAPRQAAALFEEALVELEAHCPA